MREMKDSGIEWIGEIPKDWKIAQVRYLFNIGRGRVISQEELNPDGKFPVYSSQTKDNGCLGYIDTYDFNGEQITWTTDGANAGTIFLRNGKYNCTNVCGTLKATNKSVYLAYQRYALEHIAFYHKRADTNGYKIMNNEMAAIHTLIPPISEQQRIASYLDTKCSKIDDIIEKQQSVIERLKAYKASIITEAVTKGLNPDVPMKDSGVEWIGEVPEHWNVKKLKYILDSSLQYGANETGVEFESSLPRYIRITDILPNNTLKEDGKLSLPEDSAKEFILKNGDLLFARSGATVGKTFLYQEKVGRCAFAGYLIKASINKKANNPKFLYYYTLSNCYEMWKNYIFIQSTIQNIGADKYSNLLISIPPIDEQKQIADYLDQKCSAIDSTIANKQALIEKLTAYKKSLIYEVVTGKKEVQFMSDFDVKERRFEQDIEEYLITHGGYTKGNPKAFDRKLALDTATFVSFIKASQSKAWERYVKIYGSDSEKQVVDRFCREVKMVGLLKVLRQGFTDRGIKFRAAYWKPETSINATTAMQYEANILHCTRQLHYSLKNENSIDIVLFLNGIPVVSMELKCQFTGQNTTNAINQYRFDRAGKDAIFAFNERVLVHFAVDLSKVYMTTKLEGSRTYFLPFNQGSNGAGNVGGQGNPINENGYDTAYLWEEVLCKDRLMEILHKYLHLEVICDEKTKEVKSKKLIFPRYHQLDVVTKLLADVKRSGAGKSYLIQHSAGSGKSNSIAWLAHRLSGLHNNDDKKIFQSVIIVTDRRVLDSQLQNTVYQFDHVEGVVVKVDKNSQQLKEAINNGCGIIITTLQKFPVIYKEVKSDNKRFAVIIDEAHSSQTGDAAKKLKRALADTEKILEEYAAMEYEDEEKRKDAEDKLLDELAAHGSHENLSFFAFTATPKDKTLNMFGWKGSDGRYHPFHIYSMRQAIDEGFILNVLQNYMTYNMYYKVAKSIPDNPELDTEQGLKAVRQFESLHPHNISQKTMVMLEHFMNITKNKIGGKAKAMVVTPSRLHAVRYLQEFKRQIEGKGYKDLDVLVAFSGEVVDEGITYTEEKMNKTKDGETIKENALPAAFHTDDFGMLIVAEKYQTGFDEPLLHTMFVDKKLSGVKAVQTLSRLNRTMRGKQDTFVLDFVNSAEDIQKSFEPYYEETVLESETDPNVIYDLKNTLDEFHVYSEHEIIKFADLFYSSNVQESGDLGKLQSQIKPALDRYANLEKEQKDLFKSTLARFNRIYAFITQVCRLFDKEIHKFSIYAKALYKQLPIDGTEIIDIDDKVMLEYYRLEKGFEGEITLTPSDTGFTPIQGTAGRREKKKDPLTIIIDKINEQFGTNFTDMDKVLLQIENDYATQEKWHNYANSNDFKTFMMLFAKAFPEMAATRYEQNDSFFVQMFSNPEMMQQVIEGVGYALYKRLRKGKNVKFDNVDDFLKMAAEEREEFKN